MTRRFRPLTVLAAAMIAFALAASGCALGNTPQSSGHSNSGSSSSGIPIRIAWNTNGYVRLYAARVLNLFQKHGLNAQFIRFQSGAASSAAYRSGSVDIGFTGMPGFTSAQLNGSNLKIFGTEANDAASLSLVAEPGSGIHSVKDLAGKTVGTAAGTVVAVGLQLALQRAGVNPKSVHILNLSPNTWVPAFQSHRADAIFAWAPLNYQMLASGGTQITTLADYSPDPIFWVGRSAFLTSKTGREAAARFLAALNEAGQVWQQHRRQVLSYMSEQNGTSDAVTAKTVQTMDEVPYDQQLAASYQWSITNPGDGIQPYINRFLNVLIDQGVFQTRPGYPVDAVPLQDFTRNKQ